MNTARLLAEFDRLTEASDAVPRLRRFVLDLAVRGKLAEQCADDDPAAELVKLIEAEKSKPAYSQSKRKPKLLPPVEPSEAPYGLPFGWEWVRIRNVTSGRGQTVPRADFTYIDVTAIDKQTGHIRSPQVVAADRAPTRARKIVRQGDVLYSCVRPYLLNIAVLDTAMDPSPIASTAFAILNGFGLIVPRYLWIALRSPFMVASVEERMRGQAYPAINDSDFAMLAFPLPPLAEQHRIVGSVDELMALCDQLEAAQAEREQRRNRLVAASLARLCKPGARFRQDVGFCLSHLPRMMLRADQVSAWRLTVLDLGVRGRLGAETTANPPLPAIKETAPSQRKVRRAVNPDAPIDPNLAALELPAGWSVITVSRALADGWLIDVKDGNHGGAHPRTDQLGDEGLPFIAANAVKNGRIDYDNAPKIRGAPLERLSVGFSEPGDVILTHKGSVGRSAVASRAAVLTPQTTYYRCDSSQICGAYLVLFFQSPLFQRQLAAVMGQTTRDYVPISEQYRLTLVIPPMAQQALIVAKLNALMAICDELERSLTEIQIGQARALEAVLVEALAETAA